ncbi:response regulator transcription factor [Evansella halocellulosilytica]|uniref:response regulator transcription factor n=1 Tax=Evansella halocellulosilytica TaxID=2011013 RepID=UPI000BB85231|nr:response regulator transcription factor [Evansella halocellulosilytica]
MLPSILIADRDHQECQGVEWFLTHSSIQYKQIVQYHEADEVLRFIEKEKPEIIIIELELFSSAQFKELGVLLEDTFSQLVCTSSEATYEQALKALKFQFSSFLLKPYSPNHLYSKVKKANHFIQRHEYIFQKESPSTNKGYKESLYNQLFDRKQPLPTDSVCIAFFPADKEVMSDLYSEISTFFQYESLNALAFSQLVVLFTDKKDANHLQESNRFLHHWESMSDVPLSIVVYEPRSYEKTMYTVFEEIKEMGSMIFYHGQRKVLHYESPVSWIRMDPFLSPSEQRKWIDMLNKRDIKQIKLDLYDSFQQVESPFPDPSIVRTKLTSILAQVRRYMHIYHIQQGLLEEKYEKLYHSILFEPVLYRIVQNMIILIQDLFDETKQIHHEAKYDIIEQIQRFIENNYWNPHLKLTDVAKSVNLNPTYLSSLLKRKTGASFKQHLLTIRLNESHRLLSETALSVKEIAHVTGFSEPNYFSRCFKEKFEIAPTIYRIQNNEMRRNER